MVRTSATVEMEAGMGDCGVTDKVLSVQLENCLGKKGLQVHHFANPGVCVKAEK